MMTTPLDPMFVKALRLLQSKSKDSTAQLKAMLDEAIANRKGGNPAPKPPRSPTGRSVSKDRIDSFENKEIEKRKDLDRLKTDLSQLEPKRPRLESPALSNSSHESVGSPHGSETSQGEFGDLQMNIELDCTCIICKSFNQESNNKLMECSSCQNLYHQECHDPPVLNFDPRNLWNCSRCTRKTSPSSNSSSRSTSVEKTSKSQEKSSHKSSSSGKSNSSHRPSPAKHGSGNSSSSSSASSASSKHKSSHSSSSSHTSSASSGSLHMTEAQKRLKLMKRQAAAASASLTSKKKSK